MRREARLILFYKIINGLAQVPYKWVLIETYKGTKRKKTQYEIRRDWSYNTPVSEYMDIRFP